MTAETTRAEVLAALQVRDELYAAAIARREYREYVRSLDRVMTKEEVERNTLLISKLREMERRDAGSAVVFERAARAWAAQQPASDEYIDSWDASDPSEKWSDAHAYHAGFKAGARTIEHYHGIASGPYLPPLPTPPAGGPPTAAGGGTT